MTKEELKLEVLKLASQEALSGGDPNRVRQIADQFWEFILPMNDNPSQH
jgi:hypothetical protein